MHKPLDSVVALARFSLNEPELQNARALLAKQSDWQAWTNQVELHGLSGFVSKHIREHDLDVPRDIKMGLRALNMRHKMASQVRYQALCEIDHVLGEAQIPYLALKGAALMPHLYKEGHLRPMRDMDLLLPKAQLEAAADCLRAIGYDLPREQPSAFMRDMHQLPNATKQVNGFTSSVELHSDGISREVPGHYYYPQSPQHLQSLVWQDLQFNALSDIHMLHQVSKHLEGLHSGAVLKLINVMDVVGLAEHVLQRGEWAQLARQYPHVLNTLRCLHLLTPLPESLQQQLAPLPTKRPKKVGQIMGSMRNALLGKKPLKQRLALLLDPSDWWLHLYYNVNPDKSLWWIKSVRHPLRVANWLIRRMYSRLLGG